MKNCLFYQNYKENKFFPYIIYPVKNGNRGSLDRIWEMGHFGGQSQPTNENKDL